MKFDEALASIASAPAPSAIATIGAIRNALPSCNDPRVLEAIARAIPEQVGALVPEVCLALQALAFSLAAHAPRIPIDLDRLPTRLRILWRRTQLASGASPDDASDAELLHVVTGWSSLVGDITTTPLPLLKRLAHARDARLRAIALGCQEIAVQSLALTADEAFGCVEPLTRSAEEPTTRARAVTTLSACWLDGITASSKLRRERAIRAVLSDAGTPAIVRRAAIAASVALGARDWLVEVIAETSSDEVTAEIVAALGPIAEPEDLDMVLAIGEHDPLRFAPSQRVFLLEAHRHGVFVREQHLDAVLAIYDAHDAFSGEELVRITHIARAALIAELDRLAKQDEIARPGQLDRRWVRAASILAASIGTGAHRVLEFLLASSRVGVTSARVAAALIEAAGRSPEYQREDERDVLKWIDLMPEVVIPVLIVKGGARSVERLRAIVLDRFTVRALRVRALDGLWALTHDRENVRRELATELGPSDAGLLDGKYSSARDASAAALLQAQPWSDTHRVEPLDQLKVYCESGDLRFLPDVTRLFREVFRNYVGRALAGDFTVKRLLMPELEQWVFRYARHLVKAGRSVRRWIDHESPETGRDLALLLVIDWLRESPPPSDAIQVALLESAGRHAPSGAMLRFIEPFWRRGEANVRRAAIEAILSFDQEAAESTKVVSSSTSGARGLELSLGKLAADASNPRILVQALAAVGTLRASWAEPTVRAALRRPEMAVKKEAADALAEIGTSHSVGEIVRWLARHDNAGLRASLTRALDRAAGASYVAVLVDALDREQIASEGSDPRETREKELLWSALSGRITIPIASRLARSIRPAHRELVDACLDGRVALHAATRDDLAAALHRANLRPVEPERVDVVRRLQLEGFSRDAAMLVIEDLERDATKLRRTRDVVPAVRRDLASWIRWLMDAAAPPLALELALDAADRSHGDHFDHLLGLLEAGAGSTLGFVLERLDPTVIASFFERCITIPAVDASLKQRAIDILRATPPRLGRRHYRLLGALGAVRTLTDLERCLDACRGLPNAVGEATELVFEVFAIDPKEQHDELPAVTAMRDEARDLHRMPPIAAKAWLQAMNEARPIDLPLVPHPPESPAKEPFRASSHEDLDALLATLDSGDVQERHRSAVRILGWESAAGASLVRGLSASVSHAKASPYRGEFPIGVAWQRVLDAYLAERIDLEEAHLAPLVRAMLPESWPRRWSPRLVTLAARLSDAQAREMIPRALACWVASEEDAEMTPSQAEEVLRAIGQDRLFPFVVARAKAGDFRSTRLLQPSRNKSMPMDTAMRALVELGAREAPEDVAHLAWQEERDEHGRREDPIDPIERSSLEELVRTIHDKAVERGLTVRAVHALTRYGESAIEPLDRLTTDRRTEVRSAAMRALRVVASRERTLEAARRALDIETRRDVVLSLMAMLGHGRHEPTMPALLDRLNDRDRRVRDGARDALRAWGRDAIPAIRHASRRARPDRRPHFESLIADLA